MALTAHEVAVFGRGMADLLSQFAGRGQHQHARTFALQRRGRGSRSAGQLKAAVLPLPSFKPKPSGREQAMISGMACAWIRRGFGVAGIGDCLEYCGVQIQVFLNDMLASFLLSKGIHFVIRVQTNIRPDKAECRIVSGIRNKKLVKFPGARAVSKTAKRLRINRRIKHG